MNIYLIRHGERQPGGTVDAPCGLSCIGVFQAKCLGSRLTQFQIERIYTSDDSCAVQTSGVISKYLTADIIQRHELRDIDMGSFLRGWEFINEFHPAFSEKFSEHAEDVPYPGGENGLDVMLRSSNVINEILNSGCSNIAVVTHAETIQALICGALGLGQARRFFIGAPFEHCSISTMTYDKKSDRFRIHTVNDYAHLEILNARR
jgi:broad specificity phosphatase PhoE